MAITDTSPNIIKAPIFISIFFDINPLRYVIWIHFWACLLILSMLWLPNSQCSFLQNPFALEIIHSIKNLFPVFENDFNGI